MAARNAQKAAAMKHVILLVALVVGSGCSAGSVMVKRPTDARVNREVTVLWAKDVHRVARTGDWILTRSYSLIGDAITATTGGESVSHASIYDARTGTIIESVGSGVREVPLEELLDRNRHAIVVRPAGMTHDERVASVDRARSALGVGFDYAGLVGIDRGDRFYCSELIYWAADLEARTGQRPRIVTPSGLIRHGEVVYYSGARDDEHIQYVAAHAR
jgi:uncharacterized protein YycO